MKILFDNIVINSTLASENDSNNYPANNLKDTSLTKRVQSSLDYDTVTITPDDLPVDVTDFWYAYTNATKIILRFYDYDNVLIYTHTINNPNSDMDHVCFDKVEDVYSIQMYYEGAIDVYVGGIGLGEAYVMPDPETPWAENDTDNSVVSESPYGQTNQEYIEPLRGYSFRFPDLTRDEIDEIKGLVRGVGRGYPLYLDFFDLNHDFMLPMYGKIMNALAVERNSRTYYFTLEFKEAR